MDKEITDKINNLIFNDAKQTLQKYDKTEFTDNNHQAEGIEISDDFIGERIKNGNYQRCTFNNIHFKYSGAAGIVFHNCQLNDCVIDGMNMQFADFYNTKLVYSSEYTSKFGIDGSNLNQSCFNNTKFENMNVHNTSISQAYFLQSVISECNFRHSTMQENVFRKTRVNNSSFIGCNLEYSEFQDVILENCILPFHQIPYINGGLLSLTDSRNSIQVCSSMENAPIFSSSEYLELLSTFYSYYKGVGEYFPMVNINLFWEDRNAAKENIDKALIDFIKHRQFRKIKAICKLAAQYDMFSRHELSDLYFRIVEFYRRIALNPSEEYQFRIHLNDIKKILCDTALEKSSAAVVLKSNLNYRDTEQMGCLIYVLEESLHYCNILEDDYNLDLRHNSDPISVWISTASMDPDFIVKFLGILFAIVTGNMESILHALAVFADAATLVTFIDYIKGKSSSPCYALPENKDAGTEKSFAKKMHRILKDKNIKIILTLGPFHLEYEEKLTYRKEG